jgi:AraC-like DNA-binding protein
MPLLPRQQFHDPDAFEAHMATAAPGLSAQGLGRERLRLDQRLALLPRSAMFWLENSNFQVVRRATGDLWSLTVPVRGGFEAALGATRALQAFDGDLLYLLHDDRDFGYRVRGTSRVLVANILALDLREKAGALTRGTSGEPAEVVSGRSPAGGALVRFVHHFWSELQTPGGLWSSPTALAEMEDCLVSLMALAATAPGPDGGATAHLSAVRCAEEFLVRHLSAPVTRADVARAAGVSIRALSRGFRAHHGVGPMAWLRARRLEAARGELQTAAPGEVTVTEVALRYGFGHLSRFAAEYAHTFGESPSRTLKR